jgi:hypothetical protein
MRAALSGVNGARSSRSTSFSMDLWLSEVGSASSKALNTHVLSLVVHDDDVFYEGRLDGDGFVRDDDSEDFISAGDHMVAFGTLLRLHGSAGDYPYAAWREAGADAWSGFSLAAYARA